MILDSVEGVHYIFDRYTFINRILLDHFETNGVLKLSDGQKAHIAFNSETLNLDMFIANQEGEPAYETPFGNIDKKFFVLSADSSQKEVERAFKIARAAYHPDRFTNQTKEIKQTAEHKINLIEKSAEILLNEELRPLYGERLISFYEENKGLVSTDGTVIVPIGGTKDFFSLDTLLSDEKPDTSSYEKLIAQQIQHDPNALESAEKLYESMPDNDQIKDLYRKALNSELLYLTLLENAAWAKLGYGHKKETTRGTITHAQDYTNHVRAELEHIVEEILPQEIAVRNDALRIGTAAPLLLLTDGRAPEDKTSGQLPSTMSQEDIQKILDKARTNMEDRAHHLSEISIKKQEVLEALMSLPIMEVVRERNFENPRHIVIAVSKNEEGIKFNLALEFNAEASSVEIIEKSYEHVMQDLDVALEALNLPNENVFLVLRNPEIKDFVMELTGAAEVLVEEWQTKKTEASPASP